MKTWFLWYGLFLYFDPDKITFQMSYYAFQSDQVDFQIYSEKNETLNPYRKFPPSIKKYKNSGMMGNGLKNIYTKIRRCLNYFTQQQYLPLITNI